MLIDRLHLRKKDVTHFVTLKSTTQRASIVTITGV